VERARAGDGQVVLVIGEAGIGKSRLVAEFNNRIRETPHIWMEGGGEQFFENTPFHAMREMLARWLALQGGLSPEDQLQRLKRALASAGLKVDKTAPLIADLLQLPVSEPVLATWTSEQKRRRLLAALARWVCGAARLQPLVLVVEDLHWLDPSTLDLQQLLAEQGATVPLMLLYTARPEFHVEWPLREHHIQIRVNRLSSRDTREMITQVAVRDALAIDTIEAVIARTSGVPLFVEELTRAVLERGDARSVAKEIPTTLRDSLMARLDRLGRAKEVAQNASVIGREFSYDLLQAVSPIPEDELQAALAKLINADLIYSQGIPPEASYTFKHALLQEAAYEALLKSHRRELHRQIAHTITNRFPSLAESQPEILARHWTDGHEPSLATGAWQRAAEQALRRSANLEAISYLRSALRLLNDLPDSPERAQQELTLQVVMAAPLMASRGYGAPEVEKTFDRATVLCHRVSESPQLFQVLRGLHRFHLVRGRHERAREFAEQCLTIGRNVDDSNLILEGHLALGESSFYMGRLLSAEQHLTAAIGLYNTDHHRPSATRNVQDPAVASQFHLALTTQLLGYPDKAADFNRAALSLAQELSHPFSVAYALTGAAVFYQMCRDPELTKESAEAALEVSRAGEFSLFMAEATLLLGWALARQGHIEEGVARMREGLAAWRATGAELWTPFFLALLAHSSSVGSMEVASNLMAQATACAERTGEQVCGPELSRMKGEMQLRDGSLPAAEKSFREAMDLASPQRAKFWELRAAKNLAFILQEQNRRAEASNILANVYYSFTEGFDTIDLKEAKALLDELSP
jgi:predicted ATPase